MTIALLRLYKKPKRSVKKMSPGLVRRRFIFWIEIPRLIPLGKNPVTIDDYRATAFVKKTKSLEQDSKSA